jgi:hypothetical protein
VLSVVPVLRATRAITINTTKTPNFRIDADGSIVVQESILRPAADSPRYTAGTAIVVPILSRAGQRLAQGFATYDQSRPDSGPATPMPPTDDQVLREPRGVT